MLGELFRGYSLLRSSRELKKLIQATTKQSIQPKSRKYPNKLRFKNGLIGWSFITIATIMICLFYFYPMAQALILSFQSGAGSNLQFVGFDNYIRLFTDPTFIAAVKNTVIYLIIQVPIMIILALLISVLLNDKKLKLKGFFRTAIFLPCITSLVAYSVVFKYLFGTNGIINQMLINVSLTSEPIEWLTDPFLGKSNHYHCHNMALDRLQYDFLSICSSKRG